MAPGIYTPKQLGSGHVLFVGDASLDMVIVADHMPAPDEKVHVKNLIEAAGGVVANASAACARVYASVRACFAVGNDEAAEILVAKLRLQKVDALVERLSGRTCRVVVLIEPHGEKRLLLDPGVAMYPSRSQVAELALSETNWIHTAVYGDAAFELVEKSRCEGISWSLDLEPATFRDGIGQLSACLDGASVVFCNDRAAAMIGDDPEERLFSMGVKSVIRTHGPGGATYFSAEQESMTVTPPRISAIVDTTGAGDCLAGWFIGEILQGASPGDALTRAVAAATLSCTTLGAQISYPDRSQVARLLES